MLPRDSLHDELENLRVDQKHMENDLSSMQDRWYILREKKTEVANTLRDIKKAEEELERLAEEKSQVDLDEKVICFFQHILLIVIVICQYHHNSMIISMMQLLFL